MSKQDRQGVRKASDIEQKYNLGLLSDLKRGGQNQNFSNIEQSIAQMMVRIQQLETMNMPIGSIHTTLNVENPSTIFGGEWKMISEGYLILGLDTEGEIPEILQTLDKCYIWKRIS